MFPAMIAKVEEKTVIINFNHPLAGKDLNFDVEILTGK
jgi:FKBP-type peptidyl-prolyl cis-trans isomerase 2